MLESWHSAMALNIYRQHGSHCSGGCALHEMTYEADELRRNSKRCSCPIYAFGTLHRQFKRKDTERTAWPEAKAIVSEWESADSWERKGTPNRAEPVSSPPSDSAPSRVAIA